MVDFWQPILQSMVQTFQMLCLTLTWRGPFLDLQYVYDIPFLVMDFYYNYDSFSYWVPCCDFYSCFLNDPFCCIYHFLFILYMNFSFFFQSSHCNHQTGNGWEEFESRKNKSIFCQTQDKGKEKERL